MKLRVYLDEKGLTQQQFADLVGCSQQSVARYCAGRVPDEGTMTEIFRVTEGRVEPNDFYDLPADRENPAPSQGAAA